MSVRAAGVLLALALAACVTADPEATSDSAGMTLGAGTPVIAAAETPAVNTQSADAADDPEIWVDARDPSRGLILGTDKQAGLYVYGLDGAYRDFLAEGRLNNVDLRPGFMTAQGERVLVAASDRTRLGAALYLLDPDTLKVTPWGVVKIDLAEPYGLCMGRRDGAFLVVVNGTDGQVRQLRITQGPDGAPVSVVERRFRLRSQTEGCVIDDARGRLYIGEEARGVWLYDTAASGRARGRLVAAAPSPALKPDVEGLTLLHEGSVTWLIASSQGDSAFAVWRADGPALDYRGRFSVVPGGGIDAVTGTDGVAAVGGAAGAFPEGLVVMQDDVDEGPPGERQNYKLVDWREIRRALGLN